MRLLDCFFFSTLGSSTALPVAADVREDKRQILSYRRVRNVRAALRMSDLLPLADSDNQQQLNCFSRRAVAPTSRRIGLYFPVSSPKLKDSSGLSRQNGNPWHEVGTWAANPTSGPLTSVTDARLWFGLKNSDDQGTRFDIRCEVYKNDLLVTSGEQLCVMGITRNLANAKEVTVLFGPMSPVLLSETDVLSLKVLARIGSNGAGGSCGGHSNATGLRLSFDSISRPSRLVAIP